jgi:type IV pilus assembly protein PilA
MLQKLRKKDQKGFTLIELMIVIAIIGILAAIAIPNFLAYRTKGQNSAAQSAAKNFYNTALAYFADTTSTGSSVSPSDNVGGYTLDTANLTVAGGPLVDTGTGTVSVGSTLTFKHQKSATIYTLDTAGNLTSN